MLVGLFDADGHRFPSLPLMKISAYHKERGDTVEWAMPIGYYDRVYVSRVFGDEYTNWQDPVFNAPEVYYGGTGFDITVEDGKEVYHKKNADLPPEIEHIYPDYSLYPDLTRDKAFGFLTRGCPNNCSFCIVSKKEGRVSRKVADLSEFWRGQKRIELMDANILACKDRLELLGQLADSKAAVNFDQGLDARFCTEEVCHALNAVKKEIVHFAFDFMKNEKAIIMGLKTYKAICGGDNRKRECIVYMLTNYDTTFEEDLYRVRMIREAGFTPDVRIYRKSSAPQITRWLQRWCNNRFMYNACPDFMDFVPLKDGRTIREIMKGEHYA